MKKNSMDRRLEMVTSESLSSNSIATGDEHAEKDAVLLDLLKTLCNHEEVKRIMIVPNAEDASLLSSIRSTLRDVDDELKHITLFAMQPIEGGNFKQAILGYSIIACDGGLNGIEASPSPSEGGDVYLAE